MIVTTDAELRAGLASTPSDYSSSDYIFFDGEIYSKLTNIKSDKIVVDKAKIASIESETSYYITGEEVYKYFLQIQDFIELTKDKVFVIETWSDGTNWYRKWSDGYIEQGGALTMNNTGQWQIATLPISFSDTNYTLCLSAQTLATTSASAPTTLVSEARGSRTAQTFAWFFASGNSNFGADFYACGY